MFILGNAGKPLRAGAAGEPFPRGGGDRAKRETTGAGAAPSRGAAGYAIVIL